MESVKTNTEVRIEDSGDRNHITMKKVQFYAILLSHVMGLIVIICTSYYFVRNIDDRVTLIESERAKEKSSNRELLRIAQENNINLQNLIEKSGIKYVTVPKGE